MLIHVVLKTLLLKMNVASLSSTNYSCDKCDITPPTTTATPARKHTFEPRLWTVLFESRLPFYVTFDWLKTPWWKAAAAVLWNYLLLRNQHDMMYKSRLWMQEIVCGHVLNQLLIIILAFVHTLKSSHAAEESPNFAVLQGFWNCLCAKSTQP